MTSYRAKIKGKKAPDLPEFKFKGIVCAYVELTI